ncbi:MAG: hypothetical protein BVN28_01230 [Nitrospira sp. ST-bin4]|nr:MAG: hypothetical protein BVN28_01230 [Nitrospira sp. ST-bin4]
MKWGEVRAHLQSIDSLARYLGVGKDTLFRLCRTSSRCYVRGEEPKDSGGVREFYKPRGELKEIQRLIHKSILLFAPSHEAIHGYRKKRNQRTAAMPHLKKDMLVKADIKTFFPSVKPKQVYDAFMGIGLPHCVADMLTKLCTHADQLPQGAPTSPMVANLLWLRPARRIQGVADKHGFGHTILGDDVFLSGKKRAAKYKSFLKRVISEEGFRANDRKTIAVSHNGPQTVAGLSVNQKVNVPKAYRKALRNEIYRYALSGEDENGLARQKGRASLEGKIAYVKQFNSLQGAKLQQKLAAGRK